MLATRKSDGKTLAIEHTVAEPFIGDIEDYNVFFKPSFLKLEADESLVVPGRWVRVFVPVRTLEGVKKQVMRTGIVEAVRDWIKNNAANAADGQNHYPCSVKGVKGLADFEIDLTVIAQDLDPGSLHVRRQQMKSDLPDVVRNIMERKVKKLAKQRADKRVLMLERQHMNFTPEMIMAEVRKQTPDYAEIASIDEVWVLETIGYQPGGHFMFEMNDENDRHLATITCEGANWTSRSGLGDIPICNY